MQFDWRKQVTIDNSEVTFNEKQIDVDGRFVTYLELQNMSPENILYKVKTTDPKNYVVRPCIGHLLP